MSLVSFHASTQLNLGHIPIGPLIGIEPLENGLVLLSGKERVVVLHDWEEIRHITIVNTKLQSLPKLPERLRDLYLECTPLKAIPSLGSLVTLTVSGIALSSLPPLPTSLRHLRCAVCGLESLGKLPPFLETLSAAGNKLSDLGVIPPTIRKLDCSDNLLRTLVIPPEARVEVSGEGNPFQLGVVWNFSRRSGIPEWAYYIAEWRARMAPSLEAILLSA